MNFLPEKIDEYVVDNSQKEPQILQELTKRPGKEYSILEC